MGLNTSMEERLKVVEAAIAELQKQIALYQQNSWIDQITGSFKDEPVFEEILAYGRVIRQGNDSSCRLD